MAVKGMKLAKAKKFLEDVIEQKQSVAFRRFTGGCGRKAQSKQNNHPQSRWPKKSAEFVLGLLKNAESNAEVKELNPELLEVAHVQVNQAPKHRRRTYRAHGRVNAYMSCPSHIELFLKEREESVPRPVETPKKQDAAKIKA